MDCGKVGKLICLLRKEKGMTQKALASLSERSVYFPAAHKKGSKERQSQLKIGDMCGDFCAKSTIEKQRSLPQTDENGVFGRRVADAMGISDRTVSKWERGAGCPDVSLLRELSGILGVNTETILSGDLDPNVSDGGSMKRAKFYLCTGCGNVTFSSGNAEVSCCGRKLAPLEVNPESESHAMRVEEIEGDYYVTIPHEMEKAHYIAFAAQVGYDRVTLARLYPEQNAEFRLPKARGGKLYACCNRHGLWEHDKRMN